MSTNTKVPASALRAAGFRGELLTEEPLGPLTTWRIGGPAELLAEPADRDDLVLAVRWARDRDVPWRVFGNGSNLLVHDEGVRGLVIRIRKALDEISRRGSRLAAGAGMSLPALANLAVSEGLAGLEFAAGIPGSLGGAVVMNAGWHEHEIGAVIEAVDFLEHDGAVRTYRREECRFGYRSSVFRERRGVVLRASLALAPEKPAVLRARLGTYAASRRASQPTELPSCGSVYLKPPGDFAGRLIDQAGLKGLRVGGIQVSPKHANFFVNLGSGTASDALELMERVEREVAARFGVNLTREVEIW